MLPRIYQIPSRSFFLFGPRGVGKSTWIKSRGGYDLAVDLLHRQTFLDLQRNPSLLAAKAGAIADQGTIFIDEIQKLPELLDEVHRLMEDRRLEFILTGSSARKLKRVGANLLAGRAHTYKMYTLTLKEIGSTQSLDTLLRCGSLPLALRDPVLAEETLASYVGTYLQEEIKEEALVRRVAEFHRFLSLAGQLNASILNYENIARDVGKSAKTVQSWYQILDETLLGSFVMPYRPGFKVRESAHGKFYWFDAAVARAAAGLAWEDVDRFWKGFAFESMILREIQVYLEVTRKRYPIYYYATPGAGEIDFIIETRPKTINRPQEIVSIEVKYADKWKRDFEGPARALKAAKSEVLTKMIGVYNGTESLVFQDYEVAPLQAFVERLYAGLYF